MWHLESDKSNELKTPSIQSNYFIKDYKFTQDTIFLGLDNRHSESDIAVMETSYKYSKQL